MDIERNSITFYVSLVEKASDTDICTIYTYLSDEKNTCVPGKGMELLDKKTN